MAAVDLTTSKGVDMKTIKSFAAGLVLSIALAISVSAGDMAGAGYVQNPPNTGSATQQAPVDEPVGPCATQTSTTCEEATPDPATEAMIFAMELLTSVW